MKLRLDLEYDGAAFSGWQSQPSGNTVQDVLTAALRTYTSSLIKGKDYDPFAGVHLTGSGRTDAGVHALQQVASFDWPDEVELDRGKLFSALNGITPASIAVSRIEAVDSSFDARATKHRKRYQYSIYNAPQRPCLLAGGSWYISQKLNIPSMIEAATLFCGTKDFAGFRASDCCATSTVRSVLLSEFCRSSGPQLHYTIDGKGFLKQMVRVIAGTLVEVGRGRMSLAEVEKIFSTGDRTLAGQTAPAHGLTLIRVDYRSD